MKSCDGIQEELAVAAVVDLALQSLDGKDVTLLLRDRMRLGLVLYGLLEGQDQRVDPVLALEREQPFRRLPGVGIEPLVAAHGSCRGIGPRSGSTNCDRASGENRSPAE